eukprot:scaffold21675_cov18-Tisochrysis_lutea.AAC.1
MDGGEVQCMEVKMQEGMDGGHATWRHALCVEVRSQVGVTITGHVNTHREHIAGWCHAESKGQNECMVVCKRCHA